MNIKTRKKAKKTPPNNLTKNPKTIQQTLISTISLWCQILTEWEF